jgi:glycine/D-amino acid oxidase-like deaminating enzyme/nitrite reductase/ring-hydroxylating ferredoxin subunit
VLPGVEESHWIATAPMGTPHAALAEDLTVDVAVVGAGIAGICTAWELTRAGRKVALLEADRVAAGVTGHTTAKLSAQHTLIYDHIARRFGGQAAAQYAESQQQAVEHVAEVAAELGIDCELERLSSYTYVENPSGVEQLQAEAEAARRAGLPASFTTDTPLPFPVAGAVRVDRQAQFHPRKYLLGLVDDLVARGAQVYERSRVVDLTEGPPCQVVTEHGANVTADHVVVTTHYPVFDRALLFSRLSVRRELVVAATVEEQLAPQGLFITPEQNTRSVRTAPWGEGQRLLIVTGEHFTPGAGHVTDHWETLLDWTRGQFPTAQVVHRWAAQDTSSLDKVPYIGPLHPGAQNTWVATGFGGWGMSTGVMAGQLLADLVDERDNAWASLYDPRRLNPLTETVPALKLQAKVARHFIGDRLSSPVDSLDDIPPGQGAVTRLNGKRCAVYRDPAGQLTAVSATCTHLGCLVHFNDAETAWECPCHGSRFAVDGTVLQGPANRPLEPQPLNPEGGDG